MYVKEHEPTATGVTFQGSCYAEYAMTGWTSLAAAGNQANHLSCLIKPALDGCTCLNGIAMTGGGCIVGEEMCDSCDAGYTLTFNFCIEQDCGVGPTRNACFWDGK